MSCGNSQFDHGDSDSKHDNIDDGDDNSHIDQKYLDKQSRTIGTYGLETMAKLISFKVLIVGCGGVGIEIAKNLALAGIHTIRLYDPQIASPKDMGVNFAISTSTIDDGKTRAEASQAYIAELNPNTRIIVAPELTEDVVKVHHAVIFTAAAPDLSLRTLTRWNLFCHSQKPTISFLLAFQFGAMGSIFADHGPQFVIKDADGRPAVQKTVLAVTELVDKTGEPYTRVRFETPEGQSSSALRDYTSIKFTEVCGLTRCDGTDANNVVFDAVTCPADPRNTIRIYPSLRAQGYGPYVTGGFIHELKEVIPLSFRTLEEAIISPGTFVPVSSMMDNVEESQGHLILHALLKYADKHHGVLPSLHNLSDAEEVVQLSRAILDENKIRAQEMHRRTHDTNIHNSNNNNRGSVESSVNEKMEFNEREQEKKCCGSTTQCNSTSASGASLHTRVNDEFPFKPPSSSSSSSSCDKPTPMLIDNVNESVVRVEAMLAQAELQPLATFIGAVAAQEIVKITGKYTPIHQWFHFSCEAVLPSSEDAQLYTQPEYQLHNSRYDHLISYFGKSFHETLSNLRIFMVGCGALGCENIKNFALCGITCGMNGELIVTDNDRIEVSNLSRQFLFREDNVGQSKSAAASSRMRQMNVHSHVDARQDFVGPNTEHLFPDTFWSNLDVVVNALDNMEARLYVDEQCVRFHKILVEAGTMGTSGNLDIIVPNKTTSYADGGAADQSGGIPMCTLRNFPYIYEHCIEWARSQFDDIFVAPLQTAQQVIDDPDTFLNRITREVGAAQSEGEKRSLIEKNLGLLRSLRHTLDILVAGPDLHKCAKLSWEIMFRLFRDRIYDLQTAFPHDARTKNGEAFWSGHRKFPCPLEICVEEITTNGDVMNLLIAMTNLFACALGIHPTKPEARFNDERHRWMSEYRTAEWLREITADLQIPVYIPGAVDDLDEDISADAASNIHCPVSEEEAELTELLHEVRSLAQRCSIVSATPLEFEKDDDDNFQIDFIAAASNLRAANYHIPTQDRLKVKLVAGKIIPAIATTTSAVTGLALIELLKVLQGKPVSTLRNGMADLGTNNYVLFERDAPIRNCTKIVSTYMPEQDYTYRKKIIRVPDGFTKYDMIKIPITTQTTVKEFAVALADYLNKFTPEGSNSTYEVDGIGVGKGLIWNGRPKHPNTHASIMEVIEQQKINEAGGSLPRPFWENRIQFCDLSVTVSLESDDDDEGNEELTNNNNNNNEADTHIDEVDVETATICLVIQK